MIGCLVSVSRLPREHPQRSVLALSLPSSSPRRPPFAFFRLLSLPPPSSSLPPSSALSLFSPSHAPCTPPPSLISFTLGDASYIHNMYTNHVHQGHNPPVHLHNPYPTHMPNGHTHQNQPSPQQHHPPPANGQRAQGPTVKERITVQAVPSVTVQNSQLVVGDANSSQYFASHLLYPSCNPSMRVLLTDRRLPVS